MPFMPNRWITLVAGVYIMMCSGTIYLFGVYSNDFKTALGITTSEVNLIGTLANAGTWGGILGGLFLDRFGPRPTALIGSVMVFSGYFCLSLAARGSIKVPAWTVGIFALVMGQGSSWMYSVALKANSMNFDQKDRGKVMGALVMYFGLCAGVFTQLYKTFFDKEVANFLCFLGIVLAVVALVCGAMVNVVPRGFEFVSLTRVTLVLVGGVVITFYLLAANLAEHFDGISPFPFGIGLLVLLSGFVLIPFGSSPYIIRVNDDSTLEDCEQEETLLGDKLPTPGERSVSPEYSLIQAMGHLDFWLMFFVFLFIIGNAIVVVDNIAEIVVSRSYDVSDNGKVVDKDDLAGTGITLALVSLFSTFNTLGRMGIGLASDRLASVVSRPWWLVACAALAGGTLAYFSFSSVPMMYLGVPLLGIAYGGSFCIVPTLTSEWFGMNAFASNWGLIGVAPAIGSYLFATLLAGRLNDHYAGVASVGVRGDGGITVHCIGAACYQYTFWIGTGCCGLALLLSLVLVRRRRWQYSLIKESMLVNH